MNEDQKADRLQLAGAIAAVVVGLLGFVLHRPRLTAVLGVLAFAGLMIAAIVWLGS